MDSGNSAGHAAATVAGLHGARADNSKSAVEGYLKKAQAGQDFNR